MNQKQAKQEARKIMYALLLRMKADGMHHDMQLDSKSAEKVAQEFTNELERLKNRWDI